MSVPSIREDLGAIKATLAGAEEHRRNLGEKVDLVLAQTAPLPLALSNISKILEDSSKKTEAHEARISELEKKQASLDGKLQFVRWLIGVVAVAAGAVGIKFYWRP